MSEKAVITLKVDPEVKDSVVAEAARRGVSVNAMVTEFIRSEIPIRPPVPIPGQMLVEEVIAEIEKGLPVSVEPHIPVETFSADCPNRAYHALTMHCRVCGGYRA